MGEHADLPRTDRTRPPQTSLLRGARPLSRFVVRRRCDGRIHGAEHVPTTGPVIFASNHIGIADGPLLAALSPRPVHALTKVEMFTGRTGRFLTAAGQIPLDRFTRARGAHTDLLPPKGGAVDIVYAAPYRLQVSPWPRTEEQVGRASVLLRRHMVAALGDALALTGCELPGPLPPGQMDDDPDTGVVERGAR